MFPEILKQVAQYVSSDKPAYDLIVTYSIVPFLDNPPRALFCMIMNVLCAYPGIGRVTPVRTENTIPQRTWGALSFQSLNSQRQDIQAVLDLRSHQDNKTNQMNIQSHKP